MHCNVGCGKYNSVGSSDHHFRAARRKGQEDTGGQHKEQKGSGKKIGVHLLGRHKILRLGSKKIMEHVLEFII